MTPIDRLIAADQSSPKRLAIIGDAMEDIWHLGTLTGCQDACSCFKEAYNLSTPGGAAGAARQLARWQSKAFLISPLRYNRKSKGRPWPDLLNTDLCFGCSEIPIKHRYLVGDKIVWRCDELDRPWEDCNVVEWRTMALKAIREMKFDGVLISDYDKGFLDETTIKEVVRLCKEARIPVVADAKRDPVKYAGSILKYNREYKERYSDGYRYFQSHVQTNGCDHPFVNHKARLSDQLPVHCLNHVGAGDCFAAHLLLGLVHGLSLEEAAAVAHSAGRVYVQHRFGRPPWPHEIRKDCDPSGGKVLGHPAQGNLAALRRSNTGRIVFTNGVWRLIHAGHAHLLEWAKQQGDVLVVGINDDESARLLRKEGDFIMPLDARVKILASMEAVDWIVPFSEATPEALIDLLKPDILVKGEEYRNQSVPGANLVKDVRFCPMWSDVHASSVIERIRS